MVWILSRYHLLSRAGTQIFFGAVLSVASHTTHVALLEQIRGSQLRQLSGQFGVQAVALRARFADVAPQLLPIGAAQVAIAALRASGGRALRVQQMKLLAQVVTRRVPRQSAALPFSLRQTIPRPQSVFDWVTNPYPMR